ncbi:MAG: hypothetical protein IKX23_11675 [Treponema sp.]|nr:hypothetical protein [Treponema sp.]
MFSDCKSLKEVTCLATDISEQDYTYCWLTGYTVLGTFKKASGINWPRGPSGIPVGWNIIQLTITE